MYKFKDTKKYAFRMSMIFCTFIPTVTSPKFRATRSRLQTEDHEHALQILEEEAMPVIVDQERLNKLLDNTVALTKNYRIEKLEKLYSLYSNCIYCYRQDHDKTSMIEVSDLYY